MATSITGFDPNDDLDQLHGRRGRLQQELGRVVGVSKQASDHRARLLVDIFRAEAEIRDFLKAHFGRIACSCQ